MSLGILTSMMMSAVGCGDSITASGVSADNANKDTTVTASQEGAQDIKRKPITVEIWHTRGAGKNGDMIASSVQKFNETNDLGITVVEVYQGGYNDTLTKTMQAVAAGTQPAMVVLERAAGVPVMAEQGVLEDLTTYIERDQFDMDNFLPVLLGYSYYNEEVVSLPYIRSTPVFYYNKELFEEVNATEAPVTFAQLGEISKKLMAEGKVEKGFELLNDPAWFVQNMIYQLGSNMLSEDGLSAPCLEDGALLEVLSQWRQWVDEGWCAPFVSTDAESSMKELFYQGKLGSFIASSGGLSNVLKTSEFEVGVSTFPTLSDKQAAPTGGGNIAIIGQGNDDQVIEAAWEFVKFLMTDDQVAENAANTGYLPTTYSASNSPILQKLWEETPQYKVAYDQLAVTQEIPWSSYKADFELLLKEYCSYVIQDKSYTPEQAVEEIKKNAEVIFP